MAIGRHQQDDYDRQGVLVLEELLTQADIEPVRARSEEIAIGKVAGFPRPDIEFEPGRSDYGGLDSVRKLNHCAENDEIFLAHARNAKILDVVEPLIGPDIKLFSSQLFMKPAGGVEKPYHQDSPYFTIEPTALVTCWTALDDVTLENGCMWYLPGTHQHGALDHSQPWEVGSRKDMQIPDEAIDRSRERPIVMTAGGCSFHHSLLLHRSGPNQTPHRRRALAIHYMSARSRWTGPPAEQPVYLLLRGRQYAGCV